MSCFCRESLGPLPPPIVLPGAALASALANWLGSRGLPASPWEPDPAWPALTAILPQLPLNATAMATVSAFAQLRSMAQAQFGIDLTVAAQAKAFARLVATLNLRLTTLLADSASSGSGAATAIDPRPWQSLASLSAAIAQLEAALAAELFSLLPQFGPQPAHSQFVRAIRPLLPVISVAMQLNMDLGASLAVEIAAMIRAMLAVRVPALSSANLSLMAQMTSVFTAQATLQANLGVTPRHMGVAGIQDMLQIRLNALLPALESALRRNLTLPAVPLQRMAIAELLNSLPALPYCPTNAVSQAVVTAAMTLNVQAVAAMNWQVPPVNAVALLQIGLPLCAFTAQAQAALAASLVAQAPCRQCDATAIARASAL